MSSPRPTATPRLYDWQNGKTVTPGIALFAHRRYPVVHLTEPEARNLADRLHDMADQMQQPEAQPTTSNAEQRQTA